MFPPRGICVRYQAIQPNPLTKSRGGAMSKLCTLLILIFLIGSFAFAGLEQTVLWEKSAAQGTLPGWFDTSHLTRGLSYGQVNGNDRLYVVSRNGGNFIYILDAATGDSLGRLDNTGISGGTYNVSDVGVSADGIIFVCNLSINQTFTVYKWDSEEAAPDTVIQHPYSGRLGDKFTVIGSAADNSLKIIAASANSNDVLIFSTEDNGATFLADTLAIGVTGGSASVGPLPDGSFYWNASGQSARKFSADGTVLGTVPGSVVATGSNSIRYITTTADYEYFLTFQYGAGNENARLVRTLTNDVTMAETFSITPNLGSNANGNGTGDVSVKDNGDGTFNVFVLSTNNGLGAYKIQFPVPPVEPVNMALNGAGFAGDYAFFQNDNNTRGMAYNVKTDHILVASRTGGAFIYVLDKDVVVDTLDMTGVSGGTYALNLVVADTAGVIYACNLALANGNFKIYRWENEQAVPTVAFEGTVTQRAGDAFALSGSDTTTILYASGSGATEIQVFTTADGINFTAETPISVAAGTARGGIAPVTNSLESELWINGSGTTLRKIDANGNVLIEIPGTTIGTSWMNVAYMEADNGAKLLAVNANNIAGDRRKLQVWDITHDETNPVLWAYGETWNVEQVNSNGTGSLSFKNRGNVIELLQLTTNNAIASWNLEIPQVLNIETIAAVRIDENGDFQPDRLGEIVTVRGYIHSPNYSSGTQYYMQDETAGIQVYGGSSMRLDWNFGDEILITGRVWQYRGSTEIDQFTADAVTVLSTGNEIIPRKIKIADLGEGIESQLVRVDSVWMIDPSQWPAEGSNGSVYITDGVDTTYIYIDRDTDLDGWTPPQGLMSIIAVADQYTSASNVYDDGYSLRGTFREHFIDLAIPELPLFEGFTDGTPDLNWVINPQAGGGTVEVADSTGSAWGSYVGVYTDSAYTGLLHVKNAFYQDYTIEADFYLIGDPDPDFPLYMGLGIKMASEDFQYYRLVFRNSSASDNGQIRMQGYDGANFHTLKYWNPGVDFEPLQTGWHNFKVTVIGNEFWAYIDGQELPGCPYSDSAPFLTEGGYPGIYVYNTALGRVIFDNFKVTEPTFPPPPEPLIFTPVWSLTQAAGTFPHYMSTSNYERGMAYGRVNGQDRVYVVTRNGLHRTVIHDAFTGDSLGVIPKPADAEGVGLFNLNAVDVSDDGIIFVCNMTLNNDATNPFRVYRWDSETAEPQTVISYDAGIGRLGDMFSVHGSASDNSLVIWAGVSQNNRVVKFTTTDNGQTFTPEIITLPENSGTVPNVAQVDNETFWLKSYGRKATLYNTSGAVLDTVSGKVLGTGASKIKYTENNSGKFLMAYYPNVSGTSGFERIDIIDVTNGGPKAYVIARTPSIGSVINGNGVGSIDFFPVNEDTYLFYILGTNNGLAAFTNNENFALTQLDTLFYGDTPILHMNPYGEGYIVGTNGYGDIGKYQRFDFKANDELYGFRFYFAVTEIVNTPDTLHMVVKSVAVDGSPDELLAEVATTTDRLDVTMEGNTFFLPAPLKVTGPVFIGFEWSTSGDDVFALYADADGEGEGANRAWERFSDGSYNDFGTTLNPDFSWNVDVDLWIAAYYRKAEAVGLEEEQQGLIPLKYSLSQNYPNPFNPLTKFQLSMPRTADVTITIYNAIGQKVMDVYHGNLTAGVHIFEFDGTRFASGVYFYRVQSKEFTAVKKMVLVK